MSEPNVGRESVREACPDTGTCHHGCPMLTQESIAGDAEYGMPCWRVINCGPLSIMEYPDDRWPREIKREHLKAAGYPVDPPTPEVPEDTFPEWLYVRAREQAEHPMPSWRGLEDSERRFWEHEAAAVRRAAERNGFKDYDPALSD